MSPLDIELLEKVKRIAVLAMISDDDLMETLIFKGGSAIDMIYNISSRASLDLDFSVETGFTEEEEKELEEKIITVLENTFQEEGFFVHDIKFNKRPVNLPLEVIDFWGGYKVEFKVISLEKAEELKYDKEEIRRNSVPLGDKGSTKFKIDISSYEFIASKRTTDFEDYTINVYSPEMIVFEKLRAICQQNPNYRDIVKQLKTKPRGRDFYDIELLMEEFEIDPTTKENRELIKSIFGVKKVPLEYIKEIKDSFEFHKENFETSLKDTVINVEDLKGFDYYFQYVLKAFEGLDFKKT